jgi:hypothetical protein
LFQRRLLRWTGLFRTAGQSIACALPRHSATDHHFGTRIGAPGVASRWTAMIERKLEALAPTPWNIKPLSTSRGVRVRDRNDKTLFLCEDPVLAEAIVEAVNSYESVLERIEKLQEIAILLRDRLRRQQEEPES